MKVKSKIRILILAGMLSAVLTGWAQTPARTEAILLNNRGVAEMSQQFTERAADHFAEAFRRDPKFAQAGINSGIALLALQKVDEAEAVFHQILALEPKNPQAWYNLGLTQHAKNELEPALKSFEQAVHADPQDADSLYFEGACYQELRENDQAIVSFQAALAVNPLHASAEFGLARALQRSGHTAEARAHFARFQHLTNSKIASALGLSYGEQGRYSTVLAVAGPAQIQRRMVPIHLVAQPIVVAPGSGVKQAADGKPTGGACMLDVTDSGQEDLLLLQSGSQALRILHLQGNGFREVDAAAAGLQIAGHAVACAAGDYDGDGLNDLAVALEDRVLLFRNLGHGKFKDVTAQSGLVARNKPTGITFVDYDHDGDLDLLLTGVPLAAGGTSNVLWRNNGNGTFTEQTAETGLGGSGRTEAAILTDFNNDRAVDLMTTGNGPSPVIYVNPREGKYPTQLLFGNDKLSASTGIAVLDYNKDGWMDVAVTHNGAPGLTLWRNVAAAEGAGRRFERVDLPLKGALRAWGVTAVDFDNDGWIDLAAIVETSHGAQLRVFRNLGNGSFADVSAALGLDKIVLHAPRGLMAIDLGGDGAPELIVLEQNAAPILLRNTSAGGNHFVRLDLTGLADNKTALGAKVEIFANGMWQKWEIAGAAGYRTQASPHLLVGLGQAKGIDLLRILWPTGVLQDEIDLPQQRVIAMKEADRRGSSCPVLFVWDGSKYRFVTDVIGAGVVGHWFTPTRRNTPNPGEWVKMEGEHAALVNGRISLRFMEPMEEVNYIDQLRVLAVDHPATVEVNPDERFLDDPPFASGRVVASDNLRLPVGAWDGEGHDVLEQLSRRDHSFASGFTALPYDGFANLHALTLDLGSLDLDSLNQGLPDARSPLRLLMTGYVNYFSATSLYAAWQAGIKPISPYVEAEFPDGSWQRIPGDAGFPAGLERTIVVDLTGKLPAGTRRIRLMTNLQIYWDQVQIDQSANATARSTELPLATATLRFRGYPKQIEGASPGDLDYDYNLVSLTGSFQHQRGNYTRLGDVTPLVEGIDDQFVIFGSGEEIAAEFDASALPPLPAGWKRDYFFYANGFVKDMDWWDGSPYTVAQLPFHGMSTYPYGASEKTPAGAAWLDYQLNWNDRFDSGEPVHSYRFNYQELPSTPRDDRPQTQPGETR
jgi:tetratricopeptide (TPR) repeat protein